MARRKEDSSQGVPDIAASKGVIGQPRQGQSPVFEMNAEWFLKTSPNAQAINLLS